MILSRRAALNGVELDEVHEAIVIRSIDPGTPKESVSSANRMGAGARLTSQHYDSLEAAVTFAINIPKRRLAERREAFDMVTDWALQKGWLTTNEMPERRMWVEHVAVPNSGDLWKWTDEFTIQFHAYGVPFWQDESPAQVVNDNITKGNVTLSVPGMVRTVLNVSFRNISGQNIPNFTVSAAGNTLTLNGVNLGANQTLTIDHTEDGLLRARKGNTSVYQLLTGSEDLFANPGDVSVSVNATRAGKLTVSAYGRYV